MNLFEPSRDEWPFEGQVDLPDGSSQYSQHARDNGDGTASIVSFSMDDGAPKVKTFPLDRVTLKVRPWELAERWYALFEKEFKDFLDSK